MLLVVFPFPIHQAEFDSVQCGLFHEFNSLLLVHSDIQGIVRLGAVSCFPYHVMQPFVTVC